MSHILEVKQTGFYLIETQHITKLSKAQPASISIRIFCASICSGVRIGGGRLPFVFFRSI